MLRSLRTLLALTPLLLTPLASAADLPAPAPWLGDRGDGTYRNPIIHADYSDPDAIRVGDDYWMVSSNFNHVPAIPILHSRDLVNWELVNHALQRQVPVEHFAASRHGQGVWAPAIRHHAGKFYIYYPDPDFGLYVVTATDPRGQWSEPVLLRAGKGYIDPCPFWDEDGQAYLIHGWAKSRGPDANRLSVMKLSPDGLRMIEDSKDVIDANQMTGWRTLEGPKMYKRNGYYYVFAPAGGVREGYQAVFRSKEIYGPYENRIVLEQGKSVINGPHQGAWVDTPSGEHWFLHFQDKGPFGRIVHLQPMVWREDGWPAMGTAVQTGATKGEPVLTFRKPNLPTQRITGPATSDEFDAGRLGLQWQWQANPQPGWASLDSKPGSLRLTAAPVPASGFYDAPFLLMQKFPSPEFTVTTVLDASNLAVHQEAGLVVFGYSHAWIGLRRDPNGFRLVHSINVERAPAGDGPAPTAAEVSRPSTASSIFLRVTVDQTAKCSFWYSIDGQNYRAIDTGREFFATQSRWVGAKVGVFAAQRQGTPAAPGHADFDWFRVVR